MAEHERISFEDIDWSQIKAAIDRLERGYSVMQSSGLNDHCIILLLHDASGVSKGNIRRVLDSLATMNERFLDDG